MIPPVTIITLNLHSWYTCNYSLILSQLATYRLIFGCYTVKTLLLVIEIATACMHLAKILIRLYLAIYIIASYVANNILFDPYPIIIRIFACFSHATYMAIIIKWFCGHDALTLFTPLQLFINHVITRLDSYSNAYYECVAIATYMHNHISRYIYVIEFAKVHGLIKLLVY